jgi:hypothetical protein
MYDKLSKGLSPIYDRVANDTGKVRIVRKDEITRSAADQQYQEEIYRQQYFRPAGGGYRIIRKNLGSD